MYISEIELGIIKEKLDVKFTPVIDSDIRENKSYRISNKLIKYQDKNIHVVELIGDRYRVVSIRPVRKDSKYFCFDVASDVKKNGQKQLSLHRARLISFEGKGEQGGEVVRHGPRGSSCHDLDNLSWGTHKDNMNDAKNDGSHKGQNNSSSKITDDLALAIYILSQLDLVDSSVIESLPIGKGSVNAIKAKRKWAHVVSDDIDAVIKLCKKVSEKQQDKAMVKVEDKLRRTKEKQMSELKREFRNRVNNLLSGL